MKPRKVFFEQRGLTLYDKLCYFFSGGSYEKKLRLTLLLAGMFTFLIGMYLLHLSAISGSRRLIALYLFSSGFGFYVLCTAFFNPLRINLLIVTHGLLLILFLMYLVDNEHETDANYNYLIALTVGASLALRHEDRYLSLAFPLLCFGCYLFFVTTGAELGQQGLQIAFLTSPAFYYVNSILPMLALLLTIFVYRGDYSEAKLIKRDLTSAIERNQFELFYQPQVDTARRVTGVEVLLRWHHPRKGFIPPDIFIPIAEKSGLIIVIGRWVIEHTLAQMVLWQQHPPMRDLCVSINISPMQMIEESFISETEALLKRYPVNPERVKFEITESTFIYNEKRINQIINHFTALGVKWAIDDFGSGFSSLKSLTTFPVHDVKMDKSLVMDLSSNPSAAVVVDKIIELSSTININTLAEGIETEEQFERLKKMGCRYFQGYLFSKPVNAADVVHYITLQAPPVPCVGAAGPV